MSPTRIQRRRTAGWTAPKGAKYVGRGSKWGNPWAIVRTNNGTGWAVQWAGHSRQKRPEGLKDFVPAYDKRDAHALAVEMFEVYIHGLPDLCAAVREELAGRDVMCWCSESFRCHGDTLLALANPTQETGA